MNAEREAQLQREAHAAACARIAAEDRFEQVHSRWSVVNEVSQTVQSIREHNHLRERIERAFKL